MTCIYMNSVKSMHLNKTQTKEMIDDIAMAITVIMVVHLFVHIIDEEIDLLDERALKLALYTIIGIVIHYHFVKKLINKR